MLLVIIIASIIILKKVIIPKIIIPAKERRLLNRKMELRMNFVNTNFPDANIIVNNGDYLFFLDHSKQIFGIDTTGIVYKFSELSGINYYNDLLIIHVEGKENSLKMGKNTLSKFSIPLAWRHISNIVTELLPILKKNLYVQLNTLNVKPTHEYFVNGVIWGCDINSKIFFNTYIYTQVFKFSDLINIKVDDFSDYFSDVYEYIIQVSVKNKLTVDDDILDCDLIEYRRLGVDSKINTNIESFDIEIFDRNTYVNLITMFKEIINESKHCSKFCIENNFNNEKDFDIMLGYEFEYFCANLLIENGYENVTVTQGSGDQGIDIIAYKDGIKYGVQCKCYSCDVGNKAIQEVFSGKNFYKCHVGIVLTNRHFTSSAIELANENGIILWDREKLQYLIDNSKK